MWGFKKDCRRKLLNTWNINCGENIEQWPPALAIRSNSRFPNVTWCIMFQLFVMMTSSNGNIFRVTGPLCGEFTVPVNSPHKGQWRGALMSSLICARINDWANNCEAGDLRRHRGHYDVNIMFLMRLLKYGHYRCWCLHISSQLGPRKHRCELHTYLYW